MDHYNKERRANKTQAASAPVGGTLDVRNITATGTVGHVKLSRRGFSVNVRWSSLDLCFDPIRALPLSRRPPHYGSDLGVRGALMMN